MAAGPQRRSPDEPGNEPQTAEQQGAEQDDEDEAAPATDQPVHASGGSTRAAKSRSRRVPPEG